jgi:hypothetical protein
MRKIIAITVFATAIGSLIAADNKSDIEGAAKKLAEKANYSWTQKTETSGPAEGERQGKTEGGYSVLNFSARDTEYQAVFKGDKGVVKTGEGWQTLESLTESDAEENRRMRFMARRLQQFKPPHAEVQDLLKRVKDLKKDEDGVYVAALTPEGLKEIFGRGFRRGGDSGQGPDTSGLSGRAKIWLKDGALSKYSTHIEGSMKFGDRDVDVDRTTTVEIKDVDSTKVAVPEEAKKKLTT